MGDQNAAMNSFIRQGAGRSGVLPQECHKDINLVEAQRYAELAGVTLTEAFAHLSGVASAPAPPGNAGAGTRGGVEPTPTMNDFIRRAGG